MNRPRGKVFDPDNCTTIRSAKVRPKLDFLGPEENVDAITAVPPPLSSDGFREGRSVRTTNKMSQLEPAVLNEGDLASTSTAVVPLRNSNQQMIVSYKTTGNFACSYITMEASVSLNVSIRLCSLHYEPLAVIYRLFGNWTLSRKLLRGVLIMCPDLRGCPDQLLGRRRLHVAIMASVSYSYTFNIYMKEFESY